MPELTVVICAHEPNADRLARVLAALAAQDLARARWSLLIVDNASPTPVAATLEGLGRQGMVDGMVVEPVAGIGAARRRAIRESQTDLICFLDDDTVPATDFLARGIGKADPWPQLGCWGGQLRPEWEVPPPAWLLPHQHLLAVREVAHDLWSNERWRLEALPPSAGMFLRRSVGLEWLRQVAIDPRREWLGSHGRDPRRCEDTDLAFCAHDLGLGTAVFADLEVTHIIPARRMELEGFCEQVRGSRTSMHVLYSLRGRPSFPRPQPRVVRMAEWICQWRLPKAQRRIAQAEAEAVVAARSVLAELGPPPEPTPP